MNQEQEVRARILRLSGKNPHEAAKILGVPEEDVERVYYGKRRYNSIVGYERTVYFRLDRWMRENNMTRTMFAQKSGIHISTLTSIMRDDVDFSKRSIDKILKLTGLTYEEAFQRNDEWHK